MSEEDCSICGLALKAKFPYTLKCNHEFHYECIMKSFMNTPKSGYSKAKNCCPYCREKSDYLPIVNGLKRLTLGVHFATIEEFTDQDGFNKNNNTPCKYILKRGKNKGNECGKNCFLGYEYCKIHKDKI
jgi:hypothetical protein